MIEEFRVKYPVFLICEVLKVSTSGYYKWRKKPKEKDNPELRKLIREVYEKNKGRYGYRRIRMNLKREFGLIVNKKKIYRLMKDMGLQAKIRMKRKYYKGGETNVVVPNLLNRNFHAKEPDRKWVADITQFNINGRITYLFMIKDLFNKEIVGYKLYSNCGLNLVLDPLCEAIKGKNVKGLILHTDQGGQFTSYKYHEFLKLYGIIASMSRSGNCLDNAPAESFFSHLKCETVYLEKVKSVSQLRRMIVDYIYFYNNKRYQEGLNEMTPIEFKKNFMGEYNWMNLVSLI